MYCQQDETRIEEIAMTQTEIEAAIDRLSGQITKLQGQQEAQIRAWRQLAVRSGWMSVTCVLIGAISAVTLLLVGPNFYLMAAILIALFLFASAPFGILSRALGGQQMSRNQGA
jgi:hypothetical protein